MGAVGNGGIFGKCVLSDVLHSLCEDSMAGMSPADLCTQGSCAPELTIHLQK